MDKQLYHYFEPSNENRVKAGFFSEAPDLVINHVCNGEIDPVYDIENDCIIEHSSVDVQAIKDAEIEVLREQTRKDISSLIFEHTQRFAMRGIPIPEDILQQYNEMRTEYQIKKQAILNR